MSNSVRPNDPPVTRRLRIFSFDPGLAAEFDMGGISEITIQIPWEELEQGPIGEYIEVVDVDPASGLFYHPIDLAEPNLLAQDGLAPSESNPQFHQQMVYAVAMATIEHFERALGRVALWPSHFEKRSDGYYEWYIPRLRIYPHALRDRNAYYSPDKKALLFGYFPVTMKDEHNTPGTIVHTCLSHDIVAHEVTHALLDGVHPRFNEPVNPDVHAFHEAFADIVALFQHFSYPGVLGDQIARSRGRFGDESLLPQLAQQFGRAAGRGGALRNALGFDQPDPILLETTDKPHDRGAILVAAVFGAFMKVYRSRTADLYRIATNGTGVLADGDIHPDLAGRLAEEANLCAMYVLQMCIRAIDYCPPVGITFGDYLRAVITADVDFNTEDDDSYRLAFIESFRQWGIYPRSMRNMSEESLLWPSLDDVVRDDHMNMDGDEVQELLKDLLSPSGGMDQTSNYEEGQPRRRRAPKFENWTLESNRYDVWNGIYHNSVIIHRWLNSPKGRKLAEAIGLLTDAAPGTELPKTIRRSKRAGGRPAIEVHSVRWANRRRPRGNLVTDLVVELTQKRYGYEDENLQKEYDAEEWKDGDPRAEFKYRAGCTIIIDVQRAEVRRVIRTPANVADEAALVGLRRHIFEGGLQADNEYLRSASTFGIREPFALLHRYGG